jgi:hypothetical protein
MMRNSIPCLGIIRIRCKGFDLSLSFNLRMQKRHPYWYRRQKYSFFRNAVKKVLFLLTKQRHTRCRLIGLDIIGWIHG